MAPRTMSVNERRVYNLLSDGVSISAAARRLKMAYSSAYDIANRLEHYGYIRKVPGTKSPIFYEATDGSTNLSAETEEQSPRGTEVSESVTTWGASHFTPPLTPPSVTVGMQPDTDSVRVIGVYRGDKPPEGWGRPHIAGGIYFTVRKVGSFDQLKDTRGLYIGYWNETRPIRGGTSTSGAIRIFGQESTFRFQAGNKGRNSFEFHPAKNTYIDPARFRDLNDVSALFIRDAAYVSDVLRQTGWQLTNPYIRGKIHFAWPDHPLIQQFDPNVTIENGDLVVDCSPGRPELEMEHVESPDGWRKAELMAELPSRFLDMEATVLEDRRTLNETRESFEDSERELREAVSHNARALEVLGVDVNQIISVLERTDQALLAATSALGHIAEHSALLVQINSNLVKLHSDDAQRRLDSYNVPPQPAGHHESDSTVQSKPSRFPMEGYQ